MFGVYVCEACPLIFWVGGYGSWDGSGQVKQLVCSGCGTMHRLIEEQKVCRVFALPGPVREMNLDAAHPPESAWRLVGESAGIAEWRQLRCAACKQVGQLRSRERLPRQSEYPEEPICPLCREPVRLAMCGVSN